MTQVGIESTMTVAKRVFFEIVSDKLKFKISTQ